MSSAVWSLQVMVSRRTYLLIIYWITVLCSWREHERAKKTTSRSGLYVISCYYVTKCIYACANSVYQAFSLLLLGTRLSEHMHEIGLRYNLDHFGHNTHVIMGILDKQNNQSAPLNWLLYITTTANSIQYARPPFNPAEPQ